MAHLSAHVRIAFDAGGVELVTVKELLGHSAVSVTMRYAHTNVDAKARAVARWQSSDN